MRPFPLIDPAQMRQAGLGRDEAQHDDRGDGMHETVMAVVVNVYPVDHPKNGMGQTLVDLQFGHLLPPWRLVPVGAPYAHQETEIASANSTDRQPYAPKPINRMEGQSFDLRPGTKVLVQFMNDDGRSPMIVGTLNFNDQGVHGDQEMVAVDRWAGGDDGFERVEAHPVQSSVAEYPRARDSFNGTSMTRDNRGNLLFQTTTDKESMHPGHNDIPAAPKPEGNVSFSTRGAQRGNFGVLTGAANGVKGAGNIWFESAGADKGSFIGRLRSKIGRIWMSCVGSDDGRVYFEDKQRDYLALRGNGRAELHGEQLVALDGRLIYLGHDGAQYEIVLHPQLSDILQVQFQTFNSHTHPGVSSGEDTTLPPTQDQLSYWLQHGTECRSDVVFADKSAGATPHKEDLDTATEDNPDGADGVQQQAPPNHRVDYVSKPNDGPNRWVRKVVKTDG